MHLGAFSWSRVQCYHLGPPRPHIGFTASPPLTLITHEQYLVSARSVTFRGRHAHTSHHCGILLLHLLRMSSVKRSTCAHCTCAVLSALLRSHLWARFHLGHIIQSIHRFDKHYPFTDFPFFQHSRRTSLSVLPV